MSKETDNETTVPMRIPAHRLEELRSIGVKEDRSFAYLVRKAIDEFIERYAGKKRK